MFNFFISLMVVGISLILISFILVLFDYKSSLSEKDKLDKRIGVLEELLGDADQIVQELNKFSDYIVTKVDEKSNDLKTLIDEADQLVLSSKSKQKIINTPVKEEVSYVSEMVEPPVIYRNTAKPEQVIELVKKDSLKYSAANKHNEVLRLFDEGLSDVEIAKRLNMGKGEVQLIVGMNLHKLKAK